MVILDVFMVIREKGVCGPPSGLLGIFFSLGGPVLDHPGKGVVLPGIFFSLGSPVLDLPLPPPERRGFRGARYSM